MALPLAALLAIPTVGAVLQAGASESAREASLAGAEAQARIEGRKREFAKEQFEKEIERQEPFRAVGEEALPMFMEAIAGRGDVSDLPATRIQGDLIAEFLGDEAPQFIKERAQTGLSAIEAERNKARLADLVSAGLGGALTSAGSRVDLGTQLGRSLAQQANIMGQGLQQSAIQRQNLQGQLLSNLAGLPALAVAARGPAQMPITQPQFNVTLPQPITTPTGLPLGSGAQFGGFA